MKTELVQGADAFTAFTNAMQRILSVDHSTIQKRIEEHRAEVDANPNRPGPKRKKKAPKP